jgi:hypothetical protein
MLEVHNLFDLVIDNVWVSCDKCRSESCHKKKIGMLEIHKDLVKSLHICVPSPHNEGIAKIFF